MLDYRQLDPESFNLKPCEIAGEPCVLITPNDIAVKWTKETMCFRSVIVRVSDGKVVSTGWPKFYNYLEQSHLYPDPLDYTDWEIYDKLDGSLIIISSHNWQPIVRTRGVIDAFEHDSGPELKRLIEENPKIIDNYWVKSGEFSLLYEHLSLVNPIVIKHAKPELVLIGAISNRDNHILDGGSLGVIAALIGVRRPDKFKFNSLEDIIKNCEVLKGREGYVLGFAGSQHRIKLKGAHYLFLHRAKSQISSFDKILDLFLSSNTNDFPSFYSYVETHLDHELAEIAKSDMEEICSLNLLAHRELDKMREKIVELSQKTRKDAAVEIQKLYDESERGLAFTMLSGKNIDTKQTKQLILRLKAKHDEITQDKLSHNQQLTDNLT